VPYYLGIDGGGTKTVALLGDERRTLATAADGPSNIVRVGEARTRESLQTCVLKVCEAAGIKPDDIAGTCIGGSGAARPELAGIVHSILAEMISTPIEVVGDLETSLEAAVGEGPGVIVIAGTGSSAYGRNADGITARAGGWGFAIGDEGSAHWIGRAAVAAVLHAADEALDRAAFEKTTFVAALQRGWGVSSINDVARAANSTPSPDFAVLFPVIASSEDAIAIRVLEQAGRELAGLAAVLFRKLFAGPEAAAIPVGMIGGVFRHAARTRDVFLEELRRRDARAQTIREIIEPVEGALRRARRVARQ